jgi:hypothetical protein
MNNEKATPPVRPSDAAIKKQTEYDPASKIYTAHCGVCGKARSQKKEWYRSRAKTLRALRFQFNFCDTCEKWVCEDCFLLDDGNGNSIGICTACAKEQGITGLTDAEFEEKWPEIKKRIWARHETIMRAEKKKKQQQGEKGDVP